MELVDGVGFLEHVNAVPEDAPDGSSSLDDAAAAGAGALAPAPPSAPAPRSEVDIPRLGEAARQLAEGIAALHAAGALHRDLKPSNVLVTPAGRVVILDFGLAAELRHGVADLSRVELVGTVAYMAPEQAAGGPLSEAADWYSFGAILYRALTGALPIAGSIAEILIAKQSREPRPPRDLFPECPPDLDALCVDLLRIDPAARPGGVEVLRRLGAAPRGEAAAAVSERAGEAPVLFGRERELAALLAAFADVGRGLAVVVSVHGASGTGKTGLLRGFLEGLAAAGDGALPVVLAGRCYEREFVPYKAGDSLIDALARHLGRAGPDAAAGLLPPDIHALASLFPVLGRVEAVALAPRTAPAAPDPRERRRRAFLALREVLVRLGRERSLVVCIDDVQWGDVDGAVLLAEVMKPPGAPEALLLVSARTVRPRPGARRRRCPRARSRRRGRPPRPRPPARTCALPPRSRPRP